MNNSYDEIKKLLQASNEMLKKKNITEINDIRNNYGIISEQDDVIDRINPIENTEKEIESEEKKDKDNQQGYRISGGVINLHGKDKTDLELTTDEKIAFQETMDEFVNEVSDLVDFNKLNLYPNNVEWSGKIIDFDIEFLFSIGEESGIYINGDMIKTDDDFLTMITKLKSFYEKFKSKWSKVLASRKKTIKSDQ